MNFADRVQETTSVTGTGTLTLLGAVLGYESFATAFTGASTQVAYCIFDTAGNWEVGIGTFTLSGTTLSRTTVLASSNAGSLVSFPAGTQTVFNTLPAALLGALNTFNAYTKPQLSVPITLVASGGNVSTDASLSNNFEITLAANSAFLNPTNPTDGQVCNWIVRQPATGGPYTATWASFFDWGGAGSPTLSTAASKVDLVSAYYDSTSTHWIASFRKGS